MSDERPTFKSRKLLAAAHVAGDGAGGIDWEATLRYRHVLWGHGLGVAEAMDTAQRGAGLSWELARELIVRTVAEARVAGAPVVCGAATDQLAPDREHSLDAIEGAYLEQCELIESAGGEIVLMASRALARAARSADDYARVYETVLSQVSRPVIVHWLGPAFDPLLEGYWGSSSLDDATEAALQVMASARGRVRGIKLSLLDRDREIAMRRRLPDGVSMFTGDDFNYVDLIRGDSHGHSDALLGILDAIAPAVPAAMAALDSGDGSEFERLLSPTLPLARHVFAAPTQHYKTGLVWLAYLNGHQDEFWMLGGAEGARSMQHLLEVWRLADQAGLIGDPEAAAARAQRALGVGAAGG